MRGELPSLDDVERLRRNPDKAARRTLAEKLGLGYTKRLFGERERLVADDIVRSIAHDVEVEVRRALARTIAASADIPEDVAVQLANDVIDVAEPILRDSDLLNDDILIAIVESRSDQHRAAIASRKSVAEPVSAAIIDHGDAPAVSTLVGNSGARIDEPSMGRAVDRFGEERSVTTPLAERPALPLVIAERLVALVSDRLKTRFAGRSVKARQYADGLAAQVAEGATLILGGGEAETLDLLALVDQLQAAGRLQPSLVMRAGRAGERELMQAAVSRLTGQKYASVAASFETDATARQMLAGVGLVKSEIDELLTAPIAA